MTKHTFHEGPPSHKPQEIQNAPTRTHSQAAMNRGFARRALPGVLVALLLLPVACSKGGATPAAVGRAASAATPASCNPTGAQLKVVAKASRFDATCLAAPADQPFTITLDNKDAIAHNIEIYGFTTSGPKTFFKVRPFTGPRSKTFEVNPLSVGAYYFTCDVHPNAMNGTFVVRG